MAAGKELKRIREATNMSAEKLAKAIGIKGERLRKWESMDLNPRFEDAELIEKFFDIKIAELSKIQRVPMFPKLHNMFEDDQSRYSATTKNDLIKSLQETVDTQKKYIKILEEKITELTIKQVDGSLKKLSSVTTE